MLFHLEYAQKCCELTVQLYFWCIVGVREGIKMRECDGGTAWDRVERKSYPLTSPDQSIQVSWILVCQLQQVLYCSLMNNYPWTKNLACFSNILSQTVGHNSIIKTTHKTSLVPRLSWNANMYHFESLVSFLRKHDVIKIGQK